MPNTGGVGVAGVAGEKLRRARSPEASGALTAGDGMYNQQTAVAGSINEDTWQRWNQYLYLSNEEATRKYLAKKNYDIPKNKDSYNAIIKRLQESPTAKDVDDGDALNAALDQLSDPRIQGSSLRIASTPIDAKIIGEIPFRYASEAVTIIMSQREGGNQVAARAGHLPVRGREEEFRGGRRRRPARKMKTARSRRRRSGRANDLVASIRAKLDREPLADSRENLAAERFVKTLAGLVKSAREAGYARSPRSVADGEDHDGRQLDRVHARLQPPVRGRDDAAPAHDLRTALSHSRPGARPGHERIQAGHRRGPRVDPQHVGDFFNKLPQEKADPNKPKPDAPKPPDPQE